MLWRAVFGFAGDRGVADDAVSEAYAQLLGRGDEIRNPHGWVWRAAFNIARGELARRSSARELATEPEVLDAEKPWAVIAGLAILSEQQRAVVILRDYVGHSTKETAQIIDSSAETVRVQLSRARRALREELDR